MTDVGCHSAAPVQLGTGVTIMCTGIVVNVRKHRNNVHGNMNNLCKGI